ncbi:AMP-binding protein [Idiomarina sp.]|uniref:AMP-binding protein n=1 Tax=Idiomarina sp. TaxID=1874361 RepID=UPI0025C47619|nr:AMP-binding protein [Idiomarina sp.]NQZ04532.1 AMP-binding protein [Idiomarina sp.]
MNASSLLKARSVITSKGIFVKRFVQLAQLDPRRLALTFVSGRSLDANSYTFGDVLNLACGFANKLDARVKKGKRVGVPATNSIEFVVSLLGCFFSGCVAVPIPTGQFGLTKVRGEYIASSADIDAFVTFDSEGDAVFKGIDGIKIDLQLDSLGCHERNCFDMSSAEDIAIIQYTSGTRGQPAGVCISHRALATNLSILEESMGHVDRSHRVAMNWCPFYHDMGLIGGLLNPLYTGIHSIQMRPYDLLRRPHKLLECIDKYRVTTVGGPTFSYQLLDEAITKHKNDLAHIDLRCWEAAFCGAEVVNPDVLESFANNAGHLGFEKKALLPCYGMAEFGLFITGAPFGSGMKCNMDEQKKHRVVSCGVPYGDSKIKIAGHPMTMLDEQHVGEICISGESLLSGYWEAGELTNPLVYDEKLEQYFLPTGDLGFIKDGELYVTGRLKHCIKVNGVSLMPHLIVASIAEQVEELDTLKGVVIQPDPASNKLYVFQELKRNVNPAPSVLQGIESQAKAVAMSLTGATDVSVKLMKRGSLPKTSSGKLIAINSHEFLESLLAK